MPLLQEIHRFVNIYLYFWPTFWLLWEPLGNFYTFWYFSISTEMFGNHSYISIICLRLGNSESKSINWVVGSNTPLESWSSKDQFAHRKKRALWWGHRHQLNDSLRTNGKNLTYIRILFQFLGQNSKKVFFSREGFWDNTDHVNISIEAISFKTIASKYFKSVLRL